MSKRELTFFEGSKIPPLVLT